MMLCSDVEYDSVTADTSCSDNNGSCSTWAAAGLCEAFPGYYGVECAKSCDACNKDLC